MTLVFPRLYVIMDAVLLEKSELLIAAMLAESGVELIQYRNKLASSRTLLQVSSQLAAALRPRGVRFLVNDRADIAALAGAGGVHVGQEDLSVEDARHICGPDAWVGISTHSLAQVREADRTSADYVAFGPIFLTETKEKAGEAVGCEMLRRARGLTRKPLVAIGGITLERAEEVYRAGADSLAVARDILRAPDPGARAEEYLALSSGL